MKDGPLGFPVLPHKDGELSHHLEVGPFSVNLGLPSVTGPFLGADEELGRPREVVHIFEIDIMNFSCVVFHVQDNFYCPLGFDDTPNAVYFCIVP